MTAGKWDISTTQSLDLSMQQLAILREVLIRHRDAYREAIAPFGLVTTWDAVERLDDVLGSVIEARCQLKRRTHPDYNPAGDSECEGYATDEELDSWRDAHPEPDDVEAKP